MGRNLFDLSPEERQRHLETWAELLGAKGAWEVLGSVREQVEPYYHEVAQAIAQRLKGNPLTAHVGDIAPIFLAVMPYYFGNPKLDEAYLENRAHAGRAYMEAGFTPATLAAKYGALVQEWDRVLARLFPEPGERLRLFQALVALAVFHYALALEQFTYEREEKFLKAAGISRTLFEQMAKTVND